MNRPRFFFVVALVFVGFGHLPLPATQPPFDPTSVPEGFEIAVFAGGCFWCMEPPFDALEGVRDTITGYTGGDYERPSYRIVAALDTGHREAVLIVYDPHVVSYRQLLEVFWINVNPFDATGQFCDRGKQYRSAIFARTTEQAELARATRARIDAAARFDRFPHAVTTAVLPLETFWIAEDYHQNYYQEQTFNYRYYRGRCGRDERLLDLWGPTADRRALIVRLLAPGDRDADNVGNGIE